MVTKLALPVVQYKIWRDGQDKKRAPYNRVRVKSIHILGSEAVHGTITTGNMKLDSVGIWNLPPMDTCPGSTPACRKACYAYRPYNRNPNRGSGMSRWRNFAFSRLPYFVDAMIELIGAAAEREGIEVFRIHEAGDFYSMKYLLDWFRICRAFPEMKFFAYTRSHQLITPTLEIPGNLMLRYSVDEQTTEWPAQGLPLAFMGDGPVDAPVCQATVQGVDKIRCNGPCRLCFETDLPIIFEMH